MAELRHGLYSDPTVARAVTGHFTVHTTDGVRRAAVQRRHGVTATAALRTATRQALFCVAATSLPIDLYHYDQYPFGRDLSYERKFFHGL